MCRTHAPRAESESTERKEGVRAVPWAVADPKDNGVGAGCSTARSMWRASVDCQNVVFYVNQFFRCIESQVGGVIGRAGSIQGYQIELSDVVKLWYENYQEYHKNTYIF